MEPRQLKMSDVIGVAIIVVALFGGGFDMVQALASSDFDSGEFLRGLAIAVIGCGLGLAIVKLGNVFRP